MIVVHFAWASYEHRKRRSSLFQRFAKRYTGSSAFLEWAGCIPPVKWWQYRARADTAWHADAQNHFHAMDSSYIPVDP